MVNVRILHVNLLSLLEIPKAHLRILDGVLALLDVERGALDQRVDPQLGVRGLVVGHGVHVGEGERLLLGQDEESA